MVTKSKTAKKPVPRKTSGKLAYRIIATYKAMFTTKAAADAAIVKVRKQSKFAKFGPVKKTAKGYIVSVIFAFMTTDKAQKDRAVSGARSQGASVSVSNVRV